MNPSRAETPTKRKAAMTTSRHFSRTDAITEAKRIFGADFKHRVKIEHDGAFWVLSELKKA